MKRLQRIQKLWLFCLSHLRFSTQKWSVISTRTHTLTHLILCLPTLPLNYTCLNIYCASSDSLATGSIPPMDYPLDYPLWFDAALVNKWRFRSLEIMIIVISVDCIPYALSTGENQVDCCDKLLECINGPLHAVRKPLSVPAARLLMMHCVGSGALWWIKHLWRHATFIMHSTTALSRTCNTTPSTWIPDESCTGQSSSPAFLHFRINSNYTKALKMLHAICVLSGDKSTTVRYVSCNNQHENATDMATNARHL